MTIVFSEFFNMSPKYWISTRNPDRFWSDVEILCKLASHGNAMPHIEAILKIRNDGIKYSHQDFDVLGSALDLIIE